MACRVMRILAVWLLVGLLWLIFGPTAHAATFRGNPEACASLAVTSYDVAQMRDAGIPWETFGPWITEQLKTAKDDPRSYVKDDEDVAFVFGWFKRIWDDPKLEGMEAAGMVEKDCLKSPAAFKRGRKQV